MERCISDLRKWMYQNKLKLNDDKTEFLIIGSKQQLLKINPCTVRVGTTDIKHVCLKCAILVPGLTLTSPCLPIFPNLVARHFSGSTILSK